MRTARRNAIASVATAVTGIAAALIATPLIIHHIGRAGYGVWTVSMAFVIYLGIVEAGFAPTAQRFLALARGGGDERGAALVFWSTLAFYATIGLLAFVVVEALAPQIASVFRFPPRLEQDAADLLRIVGLAMPLGLLVAALANALQGFERFTAVAITSALGSLAYLGALVLLIDRDVSLAGLGWAVIVQQGVLVLTRAVLVVDVLRTRPGLVSRDDARAMASLSARLQVSVMSLIVNGQSDRVVAGIVAPPAVVGQVGIASQLAESGRMVAAAPLVPVFNRFSALHGSGDEPGLRAAFARTDRAWVVGVLGAVAVGIACAGPLVTGWLGHGYALAGAFATMLVAAYGSNILFGVRVAYLRATANAGLESRTGVVLMILNLVFTRSAGDRLRRLGRRHRDPDRLPARSRLVRASLRAGGAGRAAHPDALARQARAAGGAVRRPRRCVGASGRRARRTGMGPAARRPRRRAGLGGLPRRGARGAAARPLRGGARDEDRPGAVARRRPVGGGEVAVEDPHPAGAPGTVGLGGGGRRIVPAHHGAGSRGAQVAHDLALDRRARHDPRSGDVVAGRVRRGRRARRTAAPRPS